MGGCLANTPTRPGNTTSQRAPSYAHHTSSTSNARDGTPSSTAQHGSDLQVCCCKGLVETACGRRHPVSICHFFQSSPNVSPVAESGGEKRPEGRGSRLRMTISLQTSELLPSVGAYERGANRPRLPVGPEFDRAWGSG